MLKLLQVGHHNLVDGFILIQLLMARKSYYLRALFTTILNVLVDADVCNAEISWTTEFSSFVLILWSACRLIQLIRSEASGLQKNLRFFTHRNSEAIPHSEEVMITGDGVEHILIQ